jgi:hypothetical protein
MTRTDLTVENEAELILNELRRRVATTAAQKRIFNWASGETAEFACCEESIEERAENGTSLQVFIFSDVENQLGQHIQQWAEEQRGDKNIEGNVRIGALATARVAMVLAERVCGEINSMTHRKTRLVVVKRKDDPTCPQRCE